MKSIDKVGNILNRMAVDLSVKDEPLFEAEKRAKSKLHSLLISKLPEKMVRSQVFEGESDGTIEAYNSAIDDMRKSIDEMFEEKK